MSYYVVSTELYHHGIKGQKWGVRRFQNKDGSLTAAGKKRQGDYGTAGKTKDREIRRGIRQIHREVRDEINAAYQPKINAIYQEANDFAYKN